MIFAPSKSYGVFREAALWQLKHAPKFSGSVIVDYIFYRKGLLTQDEDNAQTSINDVLQDAGVIDNDKHILIGSFEVVPMSPDWKTEIFIEPLTAEASVWVKHPDHGQCIIKAISFITNKAVIQPPGDTKMIEVDIAELDIYQGRLRRQLL